MDEGPIQVAKKSLQRVVRQPDMGGSRDWPSNNKRIQHPPVCHSVRARGLLPTSPLRAKSEMGSPRVESLSRLAQQTHDDLSPGVWIQPLPVSVFQVLSDAAEATGLGMVHQ